MWSRTMTGNDVDVERFADVLLGSLLHATPIAGRLCSGGEIEVTVGGDSVRFAADGANAKLRMLCARLAVVFGGASQHPPCLYGGHLVALLQVGDAVLDAVLDFENGSEGAWFRMNRTP